MNDIEGLKSQSWKNDTGFFMLFDYERYFVLDVVKSFWNYFKAPKYEVVDYGLAVYDEKNNNIKMKNFMTLAEVELISEGEGFHLKGILHSYAKGPSEIDISLQRCSDNVQIPWPRDIKEASYYGNFEAIQYYLDKGESINTQRGFVDKLYDDQRRDTPLMAACDLGAIKTVELLLEKDAKIGLKNNYGMTALSYAIGSQNLDVVKLILKHDKSFMDKKSDRDYMVYTLSFDMREDIAQFLCETLIEMGYKESLETASELLFSLTFSRYNESSEKKERIKLFSFYVSLGFDLEKRNEMGDTAFLSAVRSGAAEIAQMFASAGADMNALNTKSKESARDYLSRMSDPEGLGSIEKLTELFASLKI